jgi:membrane-associated phospholipid phosphatase
MLGEEWFLIKFIALVSFGRIFHHCHYFGDTIIGAFLGYGVAKTFFLLDMIIPAKF